VRNSRKRWASARSRHNGSPTDTKFVNCINFFFCRLDSMQRGPLRRRMCQPLGHRHGQNLPKGPVVFLRPSHFSSGAPSFSAAKSWWLHNDPARFHSIEQVGQCSQRMAGQRGCRSAGGSCLAIMRAKCLTC
jgi:hypothetical protein